MRRIFICRGLQLEWIIDSIFSEFQMFRGFNYSITSIPLIAQGWRLRGRKIPWLEGALKGAGRGFGNPKKTLTGFRLFARPSAQ